MVRASSCRESTGNWDEARSRRVAQVAGSFLRRWTDPLTVNAFEELRNDVLSQAWVSRQRLRDPGKFESYVRSIARRKRAQHLQQLARNASLRVEDAVEADLNESARDDSCEGEEKVVVGGVRIDRAELDGDLESVLDEQLTRLNRHLLRGYYEGFSCGELAERYGVARDSVKVRLFRARQRVRSGFEARVNPATGTYQRDSMLLRAPQEDGGKTC